MVDESADTSLQSLADKLDQEARPVHDWHPSHVADIDLRISGRAVRGTTRVRRSIDCVWSSCSRP
ncbi:MAG: hypothetical protein Ct9H300mP14_10470 [Gammaproteobacteria bacterium]|nr:MAG: hypothetical protein Ct9H300mP14_10470 [Gammaproteobacteria bacterium]